MMLQTRLVYAPDTFSQHMMCNSGVQAVVESERFRDSLTVRTSQKREVPRAKLGQRAMATPRLGQSAQQLQVDVPAEIPWAPKRATSRSIMAHACACIARAS